MPIYEYRCEDCGHEMDALQKVNDAPLVDCPACGRPALKKQLSAPSFRLKGSGWYETDFKTGDKRNLHDASRSEGATDKSKPDTSSKSTGESKPTGGEAKATGDTAKTSGDSAKASGGTAKAA